MAVDGRKVVLGFLGGLTVLGLLVFVVGAEDVWGALALLDPTVAATLVALGIAWLVAWGLCLRAVLAALDVDVSPVTATLLYAGAAFANNITPFGQAGGEPFSAYVISRATDAEYEHGLATIASVDSINLVPSLVIALLGLGYYVVSYTVVEGVQYVAGAVIGIAIAVPVTGFFVWRHRLRLRSAVVTVVAPVLGTICRVVPRFSPPDRAELQRRVDGFFQGVGRVATDRDCLVAAVAFSAAGWLVLCVALWLTLLGLGHAVPIAVALVVVPVASVASATPLPGGTGGVEFTIVVLLVPTTTVSAATAGAAALIFRAATYWIPTALGGLSVVALESRTTG